MRSAWRARASPDALARGAFKKLADRLADFDQGGSIATDVYKPAAYRGILMDGAAAPDQKPWPWADIKPADFPFPADPNAFQLAQRVLTPADVDEARLRRCRGRLPGDGPRRTVTTARSTRSRSGRSFPTRPN